MDITMTSDAAMYLGDQTVVTQACADMDTSSLVSSTVLFDDFTASSGTFFYG